MKYLSILLILSCFFKVSAQTIKIENGTENEFYKVYVFHEREKGRNTYEYNKKNHWEPKGINQSQIIIDTVDFSKKIKLKKHGVYTLKFDNLKDSLMCVYGFNTQKNKNLTINYHNAEVTSKEESTIMDVDGRVTIYFTFNNKTNATIYSIRPRINDEDYFRESILFCDPDRKLLANEKRCIAVIQDRVKDSYVDQNIDFEILGVYEEGNVERFKVSGVSIKSNDVTIVQSETQTVDSNNEDSNIPVDIDGNQYETVEIGNQLWMSENLKVTRLNDGSYMKNLVTGWHKDTIGSYCWYKNDKQQYESYGAMYNWYAVQTEKLCPIGWHVPTNNDWEELSNYLLNNGYNYEGAVDSSIIHLVGKNMLHKSVASQNLWKPYSKIGTIGYNKEDNNKSGFSGLPGGIRSGSQSATFHDLGFMAYWWSRDESSSKSGYSTCIHYNFFDLTIKNRIRKGNGYNVRCIKD